MQSVSLLRQEADALYDAVKYMTVIDYHAIEAANAIAEAFHFSVRLDKQCQEYTLNMD